MIPDTALACQNCMWLTDEECHHRSPQSLDDGTPLWPMVHPDDFCGDFMPKDNECSGCPECEPQLGMN